MPVELVHRAFILREEDQERQFTAYQLQHRNAARELTGLSFDLPAVGAPYPRSSMAALEAAEWVKQHQPERFDAYDLALYEAFFRDTRDISDPEVLVDLAWQAGVRPEGLADAVRAQILAETVWAQYWEALNRGVRSIPTVFIGERAISGAVPYEEYAQAAREALGQ